MKTKLDAKLGRPDSNWRLQESKSCALPLGDGPRILTVKKHLSSFG